MVDSLGLADTPRSAGGGQKPALRISRTCFFVLSGGCQVIIHVPSSRDDLAQELSRFGLIKFLSLVARFGLVA